MSERHVSWLAAAVGDERLTCLIGYLGPLQKLVVGSNPRLRAFSGKLRRPWPLWFECGFELDGSGITLENLDTLI